MKNKGFLMDIQCPSCGNDAEFRIRGRVRNNRPFLKVTDDAVEPVYDVQYEWYCDCSCLCDECNNQGTLMSFCGCAKCIEDRKIKEHNLSLSRISTNKCLRMYEMRQGQKDQRDKN